MTTRLSLITDLDERQEQAERNIAFDIRGEPIPGEGLWTDEDSRLQVKYLISDQILSVGDEASEQKIRAAIARCPEAERPAGGHG